jgi:hypothetical protein
MTSSTDDSRAARSVSRGTSKGNARFGERFPGPDDSLGDGRLGNEEGPRDLLGRQASEQAEREGDARFGREDRMTAREYETQEIIADVVVDRGFEIRLGRLLPGLDLPAELRVFPLEEPHSAQPVDRPVLCRGHEPGARVVRDARLRPPFERRDESVLREVLGKTDVAHHPGEAGDEPGRLDSPDRVDRAMGIGSRHGSRSHHESRKA